MSESPQDTFLSHLFELRDRLIRVLVVFIVLFFTSYLWPTWPVLYSLFAQPLMAALPAGGQMISTDVVGVFLVPMKIAALTSFLIMLPYVLYQAWAFVAPGLYQHEKKFVLPLVMSSTLLFFAGMAFAYFLIFPTIFKFMASFAPQGVAWMTDIEKYFGFALSMFVVFGITFETPVVVVLLVKMGFISVEKLKDIRPYVFVGAFVIGAIFTPPDVLSQFLLAVPLYILYEAGIFVAQIFVGQKPEAET
ncbi:MAG: twin-arginine translocase subunit TatC [Betaproteobacteria bacterium]|nr:twin-arginine translocase subunit TatC [Betaproteobacteria bacterium]